jgi:glycosyltransferase involved in cell wall biosynthesis
VRSASSRALCWHGVNPLTSVTVMDSVPISFVSSHAKFGGSESYLETLIEELGQPWVAQIISLEEGPFATRLRELGYPLEVFPTSGGWTALLRSAWFLRRTLLSARPAVVHANGVKAALVAAMATAGTRLPVVWVKHDFSWDGPLARAIAMRCRLIVGVSHAVTGLFRGQLARRVRVVHTGIATPEVDRANCRAALLATLGAKEPTRIVGIVGRLHPVKGQHELIEVAPNLLRSLPSVHFVLVGGEDPSTPEYAMELRRRIAERRLANAVRMLGHRNDALALIGGFDIAVVVTQPAGRTNGGEGFGLVSLEALAIGTPIVGYDDGALREIVGECGELVPSGDQAAFLESLRRVLLQDAARERMACCGRKRARTSFSLEVWVERMKECYREAASGRRLRHL